MKEKKVQNLRGTVNGLRWAEAVGYYKLGWAGKPEANSTRAS